MASRTVAAHEHAVGRLPVIRADECERVCTDVFALRDRWIRRHETRQFFTLGVPSYMDATRGRFESYRASAAALNPIMASHFDWLYARVNAALDAAGYHPCLHDERLAYPGFHIYLGDEDPRAPAPSIHYDLQYEHIDWSSYRVDLSWPLSFTLTLRLPAEGGGLHVWDVDIHALQQLSPEERREKLFSKRQSTYHAYAPGEMVVHNGHFLHQIAKLSGMHPGDARITLQGHAVSTERGWVVYW